MRALRTEDIEVWLQSIREGGPNGNRKRNGKWQDVRVFPSERKCGGHLKKLQAAHDPVSAEAGVEFAMYDFWHTFATRFAETNPDPYALAAILGHSGLRCVIAYVHVHADAMKKGMEKFDAARSRKKLKVVG
jgi:site-specific recombinase XerD